MSNNNQVGGNHYQDLNYQPIDFIEDLGLGFMLGSAIKYVCRFEKKGGSEDLLKAIDYLERYKKRYGEFQENQSDTSKALIGAFLNQFDGFQGQAIYEILHGCIDCSISKIKTELSHRSIEADEVDQFLFGGK